MKAVSPFWASTALAGVAGFVDTLGFVALFGLFTAHVTGNFVLIGNALVTSGVGVLLKLLAFPVFVGGVAFARWYSLKKATQKLPVFSPLLTLQAVLLLGFMGAGWLASPIRSPDAPLTLVTGLLGAAAMGIQNAVARLAMATAAPTTVMTGNVTQWVMDLTDVLLGKGGVETRLRLTKFGGPIVAFALGAMAGAIAYVTWGFPALGLPIVAVTVLALAGLAESRV